MQVFTLEGRGDDRKDRINRRKEKMLLNGRTSKETGSCLFYTGESSSSASKCQLPLSKAAGSLKEMCASSCHQEKKFSYFTSCIYWFLSPISIKYMISK